LRVGNEGQFDPKPMKVGREGEGRGEGAQLPPQKFFLTFWLKIVHFGVYSDKKSQFIRPIAGLKNCT